MFKNIANVTLSESQFLHRAKLNRAYVMSLENKNLLQNHYFEAGLWTPWGQPCGCHGGWEYPTSSVKGQFLGHWMSAAAKLYYYYHDREVKAKLDVIIDELEICQRENGGEWVNSNPEKNLYWALKGRLVGVPHYVIHKTMLGLWDSYEFAGSEKAKDILIRFTNYFIKFTKDLTTEEMDDLLDFETGGMMEIFANIYGLEKQEKYLLLMKKYERRRLLNPLLQGEDVLSNMHANTTVPEILGAARAYEVTGEERYLDAVKAYWKIGVDNRGFYPTGGANSGEIWCPPNDFSSRIGIKTQEHCTQYNMIRLAEFLFRYTGDAKYHDFIERSLYNSILAQQNKETGMIAYYLPMEPGAKKVWGTPTQTFWCCHGSLVQAHTSHPSYMAYTANNKSISICQFIPAVMDFNLSAGEVTVSLTEDKQGGNTQILKEYNPGAKNKPDFFRYIFEMDTEVTNEVEIQFRIPWYAKDIKCWINDEEYSVECKPSSFFTISKIWNKTKLVIEIYKTIEMVKIPDDSGLVAFMDGPYVLAGLCDDERLLKVNPEKLSEMFRPIDARHWMQWQGDYITTNQDSNIRFRRVCEICDEPYTMYFNRY